VDRLASARLYLVCPAIDGARLRAALRGGVDIVQLRMKDAPDAEVLRAAQDVRAACADAGALFLLNDRPELVDAAAADGVHLGQDDMPIAQARELLGEDRIIGISTHSPADLAGATGADYAGVGPVHVTPTKPGRPAVGLDYVRHAVVNASLPWFAIGGIDSSNVGAVVAAGATRIAVVRAITEAADPEASARALRAALEVPVGSA
jgi:thiamine-phosphate pyrophosphorylase